MIRTMIGMDGKTDYQILKETAERNSASIQPSEPVPRESGSGFQVTVHLVGYQGKNYKAIGVGLSKQASKHDAAKKILQQLGISRSQPAAPAPQPQLSLATANFVPKQPLSPKISKLFESDTNEYLSDARQGNRSVEFQIFCDSRSYRPNEHVKFKDVQYGEGQDTINFVECEIQDFKTCGAAKKKVDAKKIAILKQLNYWNNKNSQEARPRLPSPNWNIGNRAAEISNSSSGINSSNSSLELNGNFGVERSFSTPESVGFSRANSFSPDVSSISLPSSPLEPLLEALSITTESDIVVVGSKISYHKNQLLGNEVTSQVYVGYFEKSIKAAVKRIVPKPDSIFIHNEIREINILKQIYNPYLVRYYASEVQDNCTYVAMELADLGTFGDYIHKENPSMKLRKQLLLDTGCGLQYLHNVHDIVHRDIKPTNILIFSNPYTRSSPSTNPPPTQVSAKLADFGISKQLKSQKTSSTTRASGTDGWMSPETYKAFFKQGEKTENFKVRKSTDIFSYGMILFFGMCGSHPFVKEDAEYKIHSNIIDEEPFWENFGEDDRNNNFFCLQNLLEIMLCKNPKARCSIDTVLNHPFFWDSEMTLKFICTISNELKLSEFSLQRQELRDRYFQIYGNWGTRMCDDLKEFIENSRYGKFNKKYDFDKVDKLIEFIRDKNEHYEEMLNNADLFAIIFGPMFEKYTDYFTERFPELLIFLFEFFKNSGFKLKRFYD